MTSSCAYKKPRTHEQCGCPVYSVFRYCVFHLPAYPHHEGGGLESDKNHPDPARARPVHDTFFEQFQPLIQRRDGNWAGFAFPDGLFFSEQTIDFPVNLQWAEFGNDTGFSNVVFLEEADFRHSRFGSSAVFGGVKFHKRADFIECYFNGSVSFNNCTFSEDAIFASCQFDGRATFAGAFKGFTSFKSAVFSSTVQFRGSWIVSAEASGKNTAMTGDGFERVFKSPSTLVEKIGLLAQRLRTVNTIERQGLFENEVAFTEVEFRQPDAALFFLVDLANAQLAGTNFRGVLFQDVNWWQPSLRRNGLYEEVHARGSDDPSYKYRELPKIEQTYRNIRLALEDRRDYTSANDFYVGEMEAVRLRKSMLRRNLFSIAALYEALSNYGTGPVKALWIFLAWLLLHSEITAFMAFNRGVGIESLCPAIVEIAAKGSCSLGDFHYYLMRSLRVMTLQRGDDIIPAGPGQMWLDGIFRLLGPVQIALFTLALRARIKRY